MEQYEPNDLLIYARVAEAGSFSRAAERMGLPKSTVSRRITQLEDALGERLMLRTTRRLTLTEFGQQLLEHAQQVAAEVEAVKALSEFRQVRPSGRLRVSMPSDFANLLLTDMLAAFIPPYRWNLTCRHDVSICCRRTSTSPSAWAISRTTRCSPRGGLPNSAAASTQPPHIWPNMAIRSRHTIWSNINRCVCWGATASRLPGR